MSSSARERYLIAHGSELEDVPLMGNLEVQQQRALHQDSELRSLPVLSWSEARGHAIIA